MLYIAIIKLGGNLICLVLSFEFSRYYHCKILVNWECLVVEFLTQLESINVGVIILQSL